MEKIKALRKRIKKFWDGDKASISKINTHFIVEEWREAKYSRSYCADIVPYGGFPTYIIELVTQEGESIREMCKGCKWGLVRELENMCRVERRYHPLVEKKNE